MLRNIINDSQVRYGIGLAGVGLALVALVALTMGGAATVNSYNITVDDPANETVDVSVDFSGSTDATVEVVNSSGSVVDSQTLSGTSSDTLSATLNMSSATAGETVDLYINATDETVVTENDTSLTKTVSSLNVTDAVNDTLAVDAAFASNANATATLTVTDSTDTEVVSDTLDYVAADYASDEATLSKTYSGDGVLVEDDLTAEITIDDPAAYDGAYAQVETQSTTTGGGLLSGQIAGQDPAVALTAAAVLLGAFYYYREQGAL